MLPTSGYFRDILCPFLKSGLCERTHCHYRHDQRYEVKASTSKLSTGEAIPDYVPTPVSKLRSNRSKSVAEDTNAVNSSDNNSTKTKFQNIYQNIPEYKPTPISQLKKQQIGTYSTDETTDQKSKSNKYSVDSSDDLSNGKQKKSSDKSIDKSKTKNVIKTTEVTKSDAKTKKTKTISKSSESDSDKSPKKRKQSIEQNSELESDFNEELFQSLKEISSSASRKQSFDEIIGSTEESYESATKKVRIAHQNNNHLSPKKLEKKPLKPTPSQVMHQRFAIQTNKIESTDNKSDNNSVSNNNKSRIAHKPNNNNNISSEPKVESESIGNSIVGKKRVAHKPIVAKRPVLVGPVGNKLSLKLRQLYLNKFIDEYLVFCSEEEAFKRGLESEKSVYDRSRSENIYKVFSVHEVKKIRTELLNRQNTSPTKKTFTAEEMKKYGNPVVSHEAILNGKISGTFSVERRQKAMTAEDLTDVELYKMLIKYVMTEKQLKDYGYPRPDPSKRNCAILPKLESHKRRNNYESRMRNCSRCQKTYTVDDMEMPNFKEVCIYHSGRLWNERFNKSIEKKYSCCKNDIGSGGCCSNPYHIIDGFDRPDYCENYIRTLPLKPAPQSGYFGIYGLDCEMCYTTHGLELTRVTVVNVKQQTIYESLVKPSNPILDYNSKFSGIKESDLKKVTTTLNDVQTRLQTLFNEKTILIGHSLESDFKALKLIHNTVVDTAQVFPHKRGLPYKRALRTLTAEFLKKIIQDQVDGHDSQEDATAALKLMLWKIGEDLKKFKR